ncbi:MAG: metallophosphoesterase family protein [Dongiaceae bacterium]
MTQEALLRLPLAAPRDTEALAPLGSWEAARQAMERRRELRSTPDGLRPCRFEALENAAERLFARGLAVAGLAGRAVRNALDVRLVERELPLPGLPAAFDGYSILHLSDLHIDGHPALPAAVIDVVSGVQADLAVLTGDYQFSDGGDFSAAVEPLARLRRALRPRDGVLAVLGNHDLAALAPILEEVGFALLINEGAERVRGRHALAIAGLDDVHRFFTPAARACLRAHRPSGRSFGIALVHSPEMAAEAAEDGYGLYLCGHTHGGQVCLPGGVPLLTHMDRRGGRLPRRLAGGVWQLGGMTGVTNIGAGFSGIPVRFAARPQVLRLVLRRAA